MNFRLLNPRDVLVIVIIGIAAHILFTDAYVFLDKGSP